MNKVRYGIGSTSRYSTPYYPSRGGRPYDYRKGLARPAIDATKRALPILFQLFYIFIVLVFLKILRQLWRFINTVVSCTRYQILDIHEVIRIDTPRMDNREGWRNSHEDCIVGGERGTKMKIRTDNKQTHHDEVATSRSLDGGETNHPTNLIDQVD